MSSSSSENEYWRRRKASQGKQLIEYNDTMLLMDKNNRGSNLRLRINFSDKDGNKISFSKMDQFKHVHLRDGKVVNELTEDELRQI